MGQSYKLAVGQSRRFSFHLRTALGHFRPSSAGFAYRPLPLSPKSGHSASARFMSTVLINRDCSGNRWPQTTCAG